MILPGTNFEGFAIFIGGFLAACGIGQLTGLSAEGPLTICGGVLVGLAGYSIAYYRDRNNETLRPDQDPSFLFLPLWIWGIVWVGLGIFYTIRGDA